MRNAELYEGTPEALEAYPADVLELGGRGSTDSGRRRNHASISSRRLLRPAHYGISSE